MARPPGVKEDRPEEQDGKVEEDAEYGNSMFEETMAVESCEVQDILMIPFICFFFFRFLGDGALFLSEYV